MLTELISNSTAILYFAAESADEVEDPPRSNQNWHEYD